MIPFQHGVFATAAGAASGFESIATVTATGGETSLTFSSIPGTYASLQIRGITRDQFATTGIDYIRIRLNSDSGNNYAKHQLSGDGATVAAASSTSASGILVYGHPLGSTTANIFGTYVIDIHDYASTTRNKTVRAFSGCDVNGSGAIYLTSGLWMSTAANTAISLIAGGTGFSAGATFALYGIKAAA